MKNRPLTPNFTQIPNILFDDWLPDLSKSELKVLLYIMRRTYGFHKKADKISLTQIQEGITTRGGDKLDNGTNLNRTNLTKAIQSLEQKNILLVDKESSINVYSINTDFSSSTETVPVLVPKQYQTSTETVPVLVPKQYSQKKEKESSQNLLSEESEKNDYLGFPLPDGWSDNSEYDSEGRFVPKFTDQFDRYVKQSEITRRRKEFNAKKNPVVRKPSYSPRSEEIVSVWNQYISQDQIPSLRGKKVPNPSVLEGILPRAVITPDLNRLIIDKMKSYPNIEDWDRAIKNYVLDIVNRQKAESTYYQHRFSLFDFVYQKNGFVKFVNK
jgi:phage replication O-like protein O